MTYDEMIRKSILQACAFHQKVSTQYTGQTMNLKKIKVCDVVDESGNVKDDFLECLINYRQYLQLGAFQIERMQFEKLVTEEMEESGFFEERPIVNTRVKAINSIYEKLNRYRNRIDNNGVAGEYEIKKCLNDLFGIRFILDNAAINQSVLSALKDERKISRYYLRNKEGYVGLHIYMNNGSNSYFPWEIQIWNSRDRKANQYSHKVHKDYERYTKFPGSYCRKMGK